MDNTVTAFKPATDSRNIEYYRRESSFWRGVKLLDLDTGKTAVDVRFYGKSATIYCVVWIWHDALTDSARGYGKAGGYGYHKASAAMAEALQRAGVTLSRDIGGVGDSAIESALNALAVYIDIKRPLIVTAHG